MFTGTGSEEIAVEAMKAGLDDYVLKSPKHYARLPASAHLALKVARQRRELKEAERRYGRLFDSVPVALYRTDGRGCILDANPAMATLLGYSDPRALFRLDLGQFHLCEEDFRRWKAVLEEKGVVQNFETRLRTFSGGVRWAQNTARAVRQPSTGRAFYEGSLLDISHRKGAEEEREKLILELQDALVKVRTLSGLLPICSTCKKIRDDQGYWNQIEVYIQTHSDAEFTHSFCPECMKRLYPEVFEKP
jgi:PAS domain S-box-containing protein